MAFKLTLGVLAMTAVLVAPQALAQGIPGQPDPVPSTKRDKRAVTAPKSAPTRAETKPAAKPGDTAAAGQQPAANPQAAKKDVPRIQPDSLGRIPVDKQGATFGFSSETKMKAYETPDGQRIRGLDHAITTTRQPSYFGLSLSVPTTSTSSGGSDVPRGLFPLPPRP